MRVDFRSSEIFMILCMVLLFLVVSSTKKLSKREQQSADYGKRALAFKSDYNRLAVEYNGLVQKLDSMEKREPKILILSESNPNYEFALSSFEIPTKLLHDLHAKHIPTLSETAERFGFDAISVIGHTDETPHDRRSSNLDDQLIDWAMGHRKGSQLATGSNVDLGMVRALGILKVLHRAQSQGYFSNIEYWMPYSAGQLIQVDDQLDQNYATSADDRLDKSRRRIEIVLHQHKKRPIDQLKDSGILDSSNSETPFEHDEEN